MIEEDVFLFKDSTFKIKNYILFITKFHLILKKKTNNQIKFFIPLKNLYIFNNNEIETHNEKIYICLYLISTIYFKKRKFKFLFENKSQINSITNSIIKKSGEGGELFQQ